MMYWGTVHMWSCRDLAGVKCAYSAAASTYKWTDSAAHTQGRLFAMGKHEPIQYNETGQANNQAELAYSYTRDGSL